MDKESPEASCFSLLVFLIVLYGAFCALIVMLVVAGYLTLQDGLPQTTGQDGILACGQLSLTLAKISVK